MLSNEAADADWGQLHTGQVKCAASQRCIIRLHYGRDQSLIVGAAPAAEYDSFLSPGRVLVPERTR